MNSFSCEILKEITKFDVPTVCNALEILSNKHVGFYSKKSLPLRRFSSNERLIGYAATASISSKIPDNGNSYEKLMNYYESVLNTHKPTISVIFDEDEIPEGSFWGEVQANTHMAMGVIGTITEGGVRDLPEINDMGFTAYSTLIIPGHAYVHINTWGKQVEVCGTKVNQNDLIYIDMHGMVVIEKKYVEKLPVMCQKIMDAEEPIITLGADCRLNGRLASLDEIKIARKKMEEKRKETLKFI